jgi:aminopeptidase N
VTTQQAPQKYAPGCSPADDVAYLMGKYQLVANQSLAFGRMVDNALKDMYAPDPPAIMLTDTQTQEQTRALAVNQQRQESEFEMDSVPDPPAIMLRK